MGACWFREGFDYSKTYETGKNTPCDYGSRHPPSKKTFSKKEEDDWCIESEEDVFVSRVIQELRPSAIPPETMRKATIEDKELRELKDDIEKRKNCRPELKAFRGIFDESSVIDGLILRGHQIVIPKSLQ